ncbi:hypothetical protein QA612_00015 [Evansella sp. AB-P1]|uniref:hypothetical protein n=1 Tax=Evansella sp. AB-P1 TaxID=3037653 RepID=UPI00241F115C|nr:hypothetical protein [Evansella sp. AB-P1]MDG5785856.1 hypothetical protein [Evansella sp. AB-P1]
MEVYIILAVLYFPYFIWLSLTYIRYNKDGIGDSKRKGKYVGFLLTISSFHFISNILFDLKASYGLMITTLLVLLFSIYMLRVVVKDKKLLAVIEEKI